MHRLFHNFPKVCAAPLPYLPNDPPLSPLQVRQEPVRERSFQGRVPSHATTPPGGGFFSHTRMDACTGGVYSLYAWACACTAAQPYNQLCANAASKVGYLRTRQPYNQLPNHARARTWAPSRHDRPTAFGTTAPECANPTGSRRVRVQGRSMSPPMGANSIPCGSPHVHPMGRTRGEPDKNQRKIPTRSILPLYRSFHEKAHASRRQLRPRKSIRSATAIRTTPSARAGVLR